MIWTKTIPNFIGARWLNISVFLLAVVLSSLVGGVASWLMQHFSGQETLILLVLGGLVLVFFLSTIRFDFMVLVTFCLFGLVSIEPAPIDGLVMILLLAGLLTGKLSLKRLRGCPLVHLMIWFFLLANFVSLLMVKTFFDSLRFLLITVYMIAFAYFIKMYITSFHAMRKVMMGYLISAMASVFLIIIGYLGIPPFTELFLQSGSRAVGAFKDPNVFGPFLIPITILLVDEIFYPFLFPGFRWAKVLSVGMLAAAVFLSFSRAAWGSLAMGLLVYSVLNLKDIPKIRASKLVKGLGLFLLMTLIGLQMFEPLLDWLGLKEFLEWRVSSHTYDSVRFARQSEGIATGLSHLFGVGPGVWDHAHSLYVRTFAEHGVFGLISLLLFVLTLLISTSWHALTEPQKLYGLSAKVVLACLVSLLVNSVVIDTLHWRHFWFTFALAWIVSTPPSPTLANESLDFQ